MLGCRRKALYSTNCLTANSGCLIALIGQHKEDGDKKQIVGEATKEKKRKESLYLILYLCLFVCLH